MSEGVKQTVGRGERVLVYAEDSVVARALVSELLERTEAELILACPREPRLEAWYASFEPVQAARVSPYALDPRNGAALQTVIERVGVAVAALPPFQPAPLGFAHAALCAGVDYVDLSGRGAEVARVHAIARELFPNGDGPAVAPAFSLTALAGALSALAARDLDELESLRICFTPEPGFPANRRECAHLLEAASAPFRVLRGGLWCTVRGWSEPRAFDFPEPLGARTGRLVAAPDCEQLPRLFHDTPVEVRLDEQGVAGPALAALSRLRSRHLAIGSRWLAGPVAAGRALFGQRSQGPSALGVEVEGRYGRHPVLVRCSLIDPYGRGRLAALPAAHLIEALMSEPRRWSGPVPMHDWIAPPALAELAGERGLQLELVER